MSSTLGSQSTLNSFYRKTSILYQRKQKKSPLNKAQEKGDKIKRYIIPNYSLTCVRCYEKSKSPFSKEILIMAENLSKGKPPLATENLNVRASQRYNNFTISLIKFK